MQLLLPQQCLQSVPFLHYLMSFFSFLHLFTVHQTFGLVLVCVWAQCASYCCWISTNSLHIDRRHVRQECNRKLIHLIKKLGWRRGRRRRRRWQRRYFFVPSFCLNVVDIFFSTQFVFLFFSLLLCVIVCHQIYYSRRGAASQRKMHPITCDQCIDFGIAIYLNAKLKENRREWQIEARKESVGQCNECNSNGLSLVAWMCSAIVHLRLDENCEAMCIANDALVKHKTDHSLPFMYCTFVNASVAVIVNRSQWIVRASAPGTHKHAHTHTYTHT